METLSHRPAGQPEQASSLVETLARTWMVWFSLLYGLLVALPFAAPALMQIGAELPARAIYGVYSFLCHQLPERSFFLFGPQVSYTVEEIARVWPQVDHPMTWRQFNGAAEMGWKVAWSDRMVSMYTSVLLFAWMWWPLRRRIRQISWIGFTLLLMPMVLDGATHMASDLFGLHNGFRYENAWLAALTGGVFSPAFYAGDAVGSFNSWMRLLTGILFGLGVVWFTFPVVERYFTAEVDLVKYRRQMREHLRGMQSPR